MAGGTSHTIAVLVRGQNALTTALVKAEASLTSFRKTAEATALAINSRLAINDIDTGAVDEAAGHLTGMGTKAMIAGGVIAAGLGLAAREAVNFQTAMTQVSTLVDSSTTDVNALAGNVRALARDIGTDPAEAARTMAVVIKGGFREAGDATTVLGGAMRLADASFSDTGDTASSLTAILNAYGMKAGEVTRVSDQLITATNLGRTSVGELSDSLRKVTPLASRAGVGLDEVLAATSALSGVMRTTEAVGSLRGVLAALNDPSKEAASTARSLGIDFSATAVKSMGLANWLADVKAKTGGSEAALTKLFGPVKVLQGVFALTGSQAAQYASILERVKNSAGATATAFDKVNATAGDALGDAKANLQDLMISIGNVLLPLVAKLADMVKAAAGAFSAFAEQHPILAKIGVVLTAVTAGVLLLGGAGLVMAGQIVTAMAAINISTGGLLLAIGALITGITLLVLYFTSGTDDMAQSTGILATAWGYLKAAFYAVAVPVAYGVGYLVGTFTNAWNTVAAYTAEVWPLIKQVVLGAWNAVMTLLGPALNVLSAWFTTAWTSIKIVVTAVWDAIGLTISTVWNGVYNTIAAVWNLISGLFKAALQVLTGDWSGAWETIKNTFANVWENIKGIFQGWWDWFTGLGDIFVNAGKGLINAFWEGIKSAWEGLKAGFSDLLQGLRDMLPFSDAAAGPLSQLTKSGRSLLPTFARGITQSADAPVKAVDRSLAKIGLDVPKIPALSSVKLQAPNIPPLRAEQAQAPVAAKTPAAHEEKSSAGVVFERGAFQITVSGASGLDELEERLTEIFSRSALRLGVSHG